MSLGKSWVGVRSGVATLIAGLASFNALAGNAVVIDTIDDATGSITVDALARSTTGTFAIVYSKTGTQPALQDTYLQVFDSNGTAKAPPRALGFAANAYTLSLAMKSDGAAAIAYLTDSEGKDWPCQQGVGSGRATCTVMLQRFHADGTPDGTAKSVGSLTVTNSLGLAGAPGIGLDDAGEAVVAWTQL